MMIFFQADSVAAAPVLDRIQASFIELARHVLPLLGALVIVFVGYLLAALVERVTMRVLRRMNLNALLERGGVMEAVERTGSHMDPTRVAANLAFWFVMFAVLLVAADALGESLSGVFTELVGYIPSIIGAIVIIMLGNVLGAFVGGLIAASVGRSAGGPTLARVARASVIILAVFMALQELGVATQIVTTAFAILFGAVALALALAFGLGNRDLAGEITRAWYERYRAERERAPDQSHK
jgi:small-conductance mechanosensitive channel